MSDGVEHAVQEDFKHALIVYRHRAGKKYRQFWKLIEHFFKALAAAYRNGKGVFRHDIELATIACEKLHFSKKLLISFHRAQLKTATIFRAVT
ncbi:hypothetical protein RS584_15495 [Enterobacter sp. DTU_2021_1002640_1_SI_PRY_ASU_LCPMC_013]|uniref:hypothetical protein n=1 Tax=Enterobacter sp. DTU_2021_1002640_1_SI_PRY_ASU_LCPMC_013 TaxID=3077940 RepID=UPI0028E94F07|nr:hypothetical protein [Enterobacter sp. DTU_2021_1002640_1_SI_PRY_ASU_LCPMC_013]WNU99104.1 hypothetical protein RS584_15495 [Enterobacter sp. DTU_2021_1002640_1_SI_PRY_ASU_LCPMC_013]